MLDLLNGFVAELRAAGLPVSLTGSYDGPGSPHVEIEVLYPEEYADAAKDALAGTKDALAYFSSTLGPYPYEHVTVVVHSGSSCRVPSSTWSLKVVRL